MALPDSSLYLACQAVVDTLAAGIQANTHNIKIYIGSPADITTKTDEIRLNLFFYRFEPSGFQAGAHPNDPWRIRVFVLLTCLAASGDDQGTEDLRLLGMVMSYFNEHRILPMITIGSETLRLQAVFRPTTDEQINQIWSTQGDTTYRPSVMYEVSLAPVMPTTLRGQAPRVGFTGLEAGADMNRRFNPFTGNTKAPAVHAGEVNAANPAWTPIICWVIDGECQSSFNIDVDSADPASVTPTFWVAGKPGENISLEWQIWDNEKWTTLAGSNLVISSPTIEPDNIPVGLPSIDLPALTTLGKKHWQLLLSATRTYQPFAGAAALVLRSNPLLISLYRNTTP